MKITEIKKLVEGTADAAFVIAPDGLITAWNQAAVELFGIVEKDAIGKFCSDVLHGIDECGRACNENCAIRQWAQNHQPLKNYDIHVETNGKRQWCNVSVLIVNEDRSNTPYTVHIARPAELRKRFEGLLRDFVVSETSLPSVNVGEILTSKKTPTAMTDLTRRELEILRHLAKGATTADIATELFISRSTTNNHIQNILKKFNAHSRLEVVQRAVQVGLI